MPSRPAARPKCSSSATATKYRQVLDRILDSGEAVRVIARAPSRLPARVHARAEVVQGSHGDTGTITKALADADRLFWLAPPPPFSHPGGAEHYYLDFTRPACEAIRGLGIRVVGVSTLGHGYQGKAGLLSAVLAMDELIEGTGVSYRALAMPFFMENRHGRGHLRHPGPHVRYCQVPVAGHQATMLQYGASQAMAQDMADMIEAQNNGIYDAEPRDPDSAAVTATSFRQWCHDTLKPAIQA